MKTPLRTLSTIIVALTAAFIARADTIFFSDFTGVSNPNTAGWYSQNTGGGAAAWSMGTDATLGGNVLRNPGGSSQNTNLLKPFTEVTLGIGQSLQISLDLHTTATTGQFQLALLNSASTISANALSVANPVADADGYNFVQSISSTANSPSYRRVVDFSAPGANVLSTPAQSTAIGDNAKHTFTLSLTRVATGIQIDASMDSTVFSSYTDTSGFYTTFDTVELSTPSIGSVSFYANNITLSLVPEPSGALMALAGMGMFFPHRRSRRTEV